jgi:Xaa-Pro aminopeptidase
VSAASRAAANAERARAALHAAGLHAVVSARPEDAAYLTPRRAFVYRAMAEGPMSELVVLLAAEGSEPLLVTMDSYVAFYESVGIRAAPMSELSTVLARIGGPADLVAVPPESPWRLQELVADAVPGRVVPEDPLLAARLRKSPDEVLALSAACRVAEAGMRAMLTACRPGATELEVAAAGEHAMRVGGAESFCFSTIVASGEELGVMRETTTGRRIDRGDWVMIDGGCAVDGYNAEFARSLQAGGPDELFARAYRAVCTAQHAAIATIASGVSAAAVDSIAREAIRAGGFGDHCYTHITGHGIGTGVWEPPVLAPDSDEPLPAGAVVSVEPGIFIPGTGGIRIEDLVLVTDHGAEILTDAPLLDLDHLPETRSANEPIR